MATCNPSESNVVALPRRPLQDHDLDALWQQFIDCAPGMTHDEAEQSSRMLFSAESERIVRAALAILARSGRDILGAMHDAPAAEAFATLAEASKHHAERLRATAEALDNASMRISFALCDVAARVA